MPGRHRLFDDLPDFLAPAQLRRSQAASIRCAITTWPPPSCASLKTAEPARTHMPRVARGRMY